MQHESPVLDIHEQMLETCRAITREKMAMITDALALQGRVRKLSGYNPMAGALTQLAIVSRKLNRNDFDAKTWQAAVNNANDRWWEWFEGKPAGLTVPEKSMNTSPRRVERLALREELKRKYAKVIA